MPNPEEFLTCPECGSAAIPASDYDRRIGHLPSPLWNEDDEADCPGCGVHLIARLEGDGEEEWLVAVAKKDIA